MILTNFDEFILENYLLMESIVNFSDKFREILMNTDSELAKKILDSVGKDFPVKSNYFDLGKDEEHISFIPDAKVSKMENKFVEIIYPFYLSHHWTYKPLFYQLNYDQSKFYEPSIAEVGEIKAITRKDDQYYLLLYFDDKGDKQCVIMRNYTKPYDDFLYKVGRQDIRIGRGLRALLTSLGIQFTDAELEDLVNNFKAAAKISADAFRLFDVVRGSEIAKYYNYYNYLEPDKGELGNSCMKAAPTSFFSIYTQNSAVCQLVILKSALDNTKIVGRALLWKLKEPEIMFMDRIYANKPSDKDLFRQFAKKNGWHYKANNDSSDDPIVVTPEGESIEYEFLEVRIKRLDYTNFPYVDTLKYLYMYSDMYILSTLADDHEKQLTDTEGYWEGHCGYCHGSGEHECQYCEGSGLKDCPRCEGEGRGLCSACDDGDVTCGTCDGEGEVDGETCSDCDGGGNVKCEDCEGEGYLECSYCEGEGSAECDECAGRGTVSCENC